MRIACRDWYGTALHCEAEGMLAGQKEGIGVCWRRLALWIGMDERACAQRVEGPGQRA